MTSRSLTVPESQTFHLRLQSDPETLDWNLAHTPVETYLLMNLMEGLVSVDSDLKVHPAFAQDWKVTEGGRVYTFFLNPNLKWSDGAPLKAQDFVFSWKRLLSPETAASYAYFLFDVKGAQEFNSGQLKDFSKVGIQALNDHTLQVQLKGAFSYWIYVPSFWVTFPVREDLVAKHGSQWSFPGKMVTAGPYLLEDQQVGSKVVLKANPNYQGERKNIQKIIAWIVNDDSTALKLYDSGRIDFLNDLPTVELSRLDGRADLKTFPYLKTGYIGFTMDSPGINLGRNKHLRRAISMALDKSKIPSLLRGAQKVASSWVPDPLLGYEKSMGLAFNPLKAKEELAKAMEELKPSKATQATRSMHQSEDSKTTTQVAKSQVLKAQVPISLSLLVLHWDRSLLLGEWIQGELKKNLGINVTLEPFDHKTFRAKQSQRQYPCFLSSWSADIPDPDNFVSVFLSGVGNNRTGWKNSTYDDGVLEARTQLERVKRSKVYKNIQKILVEDESVIIPLYYEANRALVSPRVKNLSLSPLNTLPLKEVELAN